MQTNHTLLLLTVGFVAFLFIIQIETFNHNSTVELFDDAPNRVAVVETPPKSSSSSSSSSFKAIKEIGSINSVDEVFKHISLPCQRSPSNFFTHNFDINATACIPSMGDDYALFLSLGEILPHFKRVVIIYHPFDSGNFEIPDLTLNVLEYYCILFPQNLFVIPATEYNWVQPRQDCLEQFRDEHMFFLDADDVVVNPKTFQKVIKSGYPRVFMKLKVLVGDLFHVHKKGQQWDKCHTYLNTKKCPNAFWRPIEGTKSFSKFWKGSAFLDKCAEKHRHSGGVSVFHLQGVKSDYRMCMRFRFNNYLKQNNNTLEGLKLKEKTDLDKCANRNFNKHYVIKKMSEKDSKQVSARLSRCTRFNMSKVGKLWKRIDRGWTAEDIANGKC